MPLGDLVLLGPGGNAGAGGHREREGRFLTIVVPRGHWGATHAPRAVLDPVRWSAGTPSKGRKYGLIRALEGRKKIAGRRPLIGPSRIRPANLAGRGSMPTVRRDTGDGRCERTDHFGRSTTGEFAISGRSRCAHPPATLAAYVLTFFLISQFAPSPCSPDWLLRLGDRGQRVVRKSAAGRRRVPISAGGDSEYRRPRRADPELGLRRRTVIGPGRRPPRRPWPRRAADGSARGVECEFRPACSLARDAIARSLRRGQSAVPTDAAGEGGRSRSFPHPHHRQNHCRPRSG